MSGLGQGGESFAMLFGRTEPFDEAALMALYPDGKEEYLKRFEGSLDDTIEGGFILEDDREEILEVTALSYPLRELFEGCPGGVYELKTITGRPLGMDGVRPFGIPELRLVSAGGVQPLSPTPDCGTSMTGS